MNNNLLIKNGLLVFYDKILKRDILISNGKIMSINNSISKNISINTIDAEDRYILPGGIDVHTHMELKADNNFISADDYKNGSKSAIMGGITSYFGFVYQDKKESILKTLYRELKKSSNSYCDKKFHIGINNITDKLEHDIKSSVKNDFKSFKLHLNDPEVDTVFLMRVFKLIARYNGLAFCHCEDGNIIEFLKKDKKKNKKLKLKYYPEIRKDYVEKIAIDNVINIAEQFNTKIYIAHLSSKIGLDSIREAKIKNKNRIEVETCPQYLLFADNIYNRKDGYLYTCSPSFKSREDNKSLWQGLREGIIKVVSSDHCPFKRREKERGKNNFIKIPLGIPGIETLYPIMLSEGKKRKFNINEIVKWISTNPAKIFDLYPNKGIIEKGSQADLVIYNPKKSYRISYKELNMNCDYSPYEGLKINGKIEEVILKGKVVMRDDKFLQ